MSKAKHLVCYEYTSDNGVFQNRYEKYNGTSILELEYPEISSEEIEARIIPNLFPNSKYFTIKNIILIAHE